jgi:hypothetical protein
MARWDEDDYWEDTDETPDSQVPVEEALQKSVYMVPDPFWGFEVFGRIEHPGVCVRCDLPNRQAFLNKGTDPRSARTDRYLVLSVEPSAENGLRKPTAFALDPRAVRLHKLLNLHKSPGPCGRLEDVYFRLMEEHFENLLRLLGRKSP